MNRRDAIKTVGLGLCAPSVALAEGFKIREINIDYEQKYWEAQSHIDKLEELVRHYDVNRELANHYEALDLNEKFAK
jgi:hypothetical protein